MIFGGLIVVALFAALIAPFFIDWTAYRTEFEREATKIVGQPVHVAGTAKVRILPLPSVTFTDLTVGQNPDGTPMMTVDAFSMHAELMPFLSGEVRIVDMLIERPKVTVAVSEGGTVAWTARKEYPVNPEKVQLDNLRIEDGSIRIEGLAGGRVIEGRNFAASIRAQSLIGPWHIAANGIVDGVPVALDVSTGRRRDKGTLRVKAVARRAGQPYSLTVDGPLALKDGVLSWQGGFDVQPSHEPAIAGEGTLGEPLPVRVEGEFAATPQAVDLPKYRMEVGPREDPYTITGTAHANIRDEVAFTATAEGRQIDLDRLQAAPGDKTTAKTVPKRGNEAGKRSVSLDQRIAVLHDLVDRIPIPQAKGRIDIMLPAIVAGDTVFREVRARVEPDGDGWHVSDLKAALPGNTKVEARGRLGTGGDFGFSGHMVLASRQPTGFAAWLAGKSNAALRHLNRAGFSADVTFSGSQSTFDNLELVLNDETLKGKLQRLAPVGGKGPNGSGGRPGIIADLSGDRINVDDLMAIYSLTEKDNGPVLTNHDLDIALKAKELKGMQLQARNVDAQLRVEGGSVTVEHLDVGDFYGARIKGSGRLNDLMNQPSGQIKLQMEASDGAALARLAADRLGDNRLFAAFADDPSLSRGLSLKLDVETRPQGGQSKGTLTASGWAGGTAFAVRDRFEGKPARWRQAHHDAFAKFEQNDPLVLARQFALPVTPVDADGPVTVTLEAGGNPRDGLNVDLSANAARTDLSAKGSLAFPNAGDGAPEGIFGTPQFDLVVTLGAKDIDPWLLMAGYPLPGTGEGHPASVSLEATGSGGVYHFAHISGTHGDNRFGGEIGIDTAREGGPKATGNLSFDTISAPFVAELLLGTGTVSGDGVTPGIADTGFGTPLIGGLNADVKLNAAHFDLGGGPIGEAFAADAVLIDGALSLPQLSARWAGGTMTGNLAIRNSAGDAIVNTQLSLGGIDAAQLAALAGFAPVVTGKADIGVTLDASGRSFKGLVSALSGSGVFSLTDGVIDGISTGGLETILAAADQKDFEITSQTVAPIARKAVLQGRFVSSDVSGAFSLAQGRLSARNVELSDPGGTIEVNGSFAPVDDHAEISARVKLDAGKEALAGGDPVLDLAWAGSPDALGLTLDTKALEGYLSLRAFEREQRKVEMLQESVLERQRLRRETVLTKMRIARREQARKQELQRLQDLQQRLQQERKAKELANPEKAATGQPSGDNTGANSGQTANAPADAASPSAGREPVLPTDNAPVPEPAPRQTGSTKAASPSTGSGKAVVVEPLPAPKSASGGQDTTLFDDITRKLYGNGSGN